MELGKPREAVPYLESLSGTVFPADYERGRIHEQLGELDQARDAYAAFVAVCQDADPQFQPMVQEAQAAIRRVTTATPE